MAEEASVATEALPQRPKKERAPKPAAPKEKAAAAAADEEVVEAPAVLPDEAEVNAQVAALEQFAAQEKEKINNMRAILRDKDAIRQAAKAEVEAHRVRLDAVKSQLAAKMQEKNELMPKVNSRTDTEKELKKQKRELQYGSVQELEAAIKQLEFDMAHSSMSLKEEKDMLAQIKRLNGLKDQIRAHEAQWDEFSKGKDDQDALVAILRVKNEELAAIRAVNQAESATFGELRDKQKAAEGEIKAVRESIAASMKAVDEAYGKIKAIRKKYRDLVSAYYKTRRDTSRQAFKATPAKPDTREIEDFLRRQREKLVSAGIKWEGDSSPAAAPSAPIVPGAAPEESKPEGKAVKAKGSKANGAAPAPAAEAADEAKSSKSKDKGVPKAQRVAEWSPEEVETKTVQIVEEPIVDDDTQETDAQRLERVARERAEAEARRKKREEQKQQREVARADRERMDKEKKREDRKLKKLKKLEGRLKGAAGSGAEASAEDTQTGEEKTDQVESAQEATDTDTGKKQQGGQQSIAQRQAAAKLAEARARSEIESKLKAKRGAAKIPIVGTKIPKINWQMYLAVGGALLVLVIGVIMALTSNNAAAAAKS
eukprot:tig00000076_g2388.t1